MPEYTGTVSKITGTAGLQRVKAPNAGEGLNVQMIHSSTLNELFVLRHILHEYTAHSSPELEFLRSRDACAGAGLGACLVSGCLFAPPCLCTGRSPLGLGVQFSSICSI